MLPAGAAAALAVLAALQIGWSRPIVLPPVDAITPVRLVPVFLAPLPVDAGTALFAAGPAAAATVTQPLEGARAVGVARQGGRALAFVQAGDGRVSRLAPGQAYAGWQLVGIGTDALRFRRGGQETSLPIGAGAPAATATGDKG